MQKYHLPGVAREERRSHDGLLNTTHKTLHVTACLAVRFV